MNVIKFYTFLFSKSFDILTEFNKTRDSESIIKTQKKFNFLINDFVLSNSHKYISNNKKIENQFFIDFLNESILNHLKKRIRIFKITKLLGKKLFQITSFMILFIFSLKKFFIGFSHNLKTFKSYDYSNLREITACFGFPSHSFVYEENPSYPSSFIEYLILNNLINKNHRVLSIDEYVRPKKINKHSNSNSNFYNRISVKKKTILNNIFKVPLNIYKSYQRFNKEFKNKNLLLFFYYYEKYSKSNLILELINTCKEQRIELKQFYFLTPYDIGLLKYDENITNFNFYSYSQNEFIPPSINIHNEIENKTNTLDIDEILEEITLDFFSMYHHNLINVTNHLNFYNNIVEKIKNKYGVNLQKCKFLENQNFNSNLGFEETIKIKLDSSKKNILLFDLPVESYESTMKRQFTGDYFGTEHFILSFYKNIIEIFAVHEINLFLKPKYSIHKKNINIFYSKLINQFSSKNINLEIIDPYNKILLEDRKFDIMLNLPYTSTHYTLENLAYSNNFYVPEQYLKYFENKNNKIIGSNALVNLLKF
jgi:hypothetical protein